MVCCLLAGCSADNDEEATKIELAPMAVIGIRSLTEFPVEEKFTGLVEAARTAQLAFEVPGTVVSVSLDEGERVKVGDVLALVDTERLKAQREQVVASRIQAEAASELAESEYERDAKLIKLDAATGQQLQRTKQAFESAVAVVEQIDSQLAAIDVDLRKSELRAPFSGTISKRFIDEGAVVSPSQPAFNLLETGSLEVRVAMNLSNGEAVEVGTELTVKRADGERFKLPIARILPQRDSSTRTTDVILTLAGDENDLKPGDLLDVIYTKTVTETGFLVPRSALTESSRGLWACFVAEPAPKLSENAEQLRRADLEIIHSYTSSVVARGGIREGDRIVASGLQKVSAGQYIRIVETLEPLRPPENE